MKKTQIERIIKKGSARQKIRLYFTDIAYYNCEEVQSLEVEGSGENATLVRKFALLTEKERALILESIQANKDIDYYEDLREWNRAFIMFKPYISNYRSSIQLLVTDLKMNIRTMTLHKVYQKAINNIFEVGRAEGKTLDWAVDAVKNVIDTLINTASKSLSMFGAERYQEEGLPPFVKIPEAEKWEDIWLSIEMLNEKIVEAKDYIETIKTFLNNHLPLQPYKDFVKLEEKEIKEQIKKSKDVLELFLKTHLELMPKGEDDLLKLMEEAAKTPDDIRDVERLKIKSWEEIEINVRDEDIEDIKNAGR